MDVEQKLRSAGLAAVHVDTDAALQRTVGRGEAQRTRRWRAAVAGIGTAFVALSVGAVLFNQRDENGQRVGTDSLTTNGSVAPYREAGDPAVWKIDLTDPPDATASSFTALVTRIGCNGGVTGRVLRPGVVAEPDRVVITFTVEKDLDGGECPANDEVPYLVEVSEAIGNRRLFDGDALRWDPSRPATTRPSTTPIPEAHECDAAEGTILDVAGEPNWRPYAEYSPWTDTNGCLLRIDFVAERTGPEHCDLESARVLITGRPLGTSYRSETHPQFVRDPEGAFGRPEFVAGFDPDATLPDGAVDSGYRREELQLWHVPGDQTAIWIVSPDRVERWPAGETPICN